MPGEGRCHERNNRLAVFSQLLLGYCKPCYFAKQLLDLRHSVCCDFVRVLDVVRETRVNVEMPQQPLPMLRRVLHQGVG